MNNPPRSQLNYCIWRYFGEIMWSQGSKVKKSLSHLGRTSCQSGGIDVWTCHLILNTQILSLPVFCRLFDLPSLFAVIQEALVTFLGEIHHWDIIHSNSFWARNKKCLKPRGFKQTVQRQLLGPVEREEGGWDCSPEPGEKKEWKGGRASLRRVGREAECGDWGAWSRQEKRHMSCACGHHRLNTHGNGTFGKLWAIFTCKALFKHLAFVQTVLPLCLCLESLLHRQ